MRFQLQTMLTTRCNLHCKYCYMRVNERDNHPKDMTLSDFKSALEFLPAVQHSLQYSSDLVPNYDVAFFGGEPLLCFDVMCDITNYVKSLHKDTTCFVPTNTTLLTIEKYNKLTDIGVSVSLSYDGPFDNQRSNSQSSIRLTDYALSLISERGCKVMVSPDNVYSLYRNFLFFVENNVISPGLCLVRDNIWDISSLRELDVQLNKVYKFILDTFETRGVLFLPEILSLYMLNIVVFAMYGKRGRGCFVGVDGVAVFGDGDIYPCARFGSNYRFKLGNYKERTLLTDNINFLIDNSSTFNSFCESCDIFDVCNMGCYYSQLSFGDWKRNKPVSCVCEAFKICTKYAYMLYERLKNYSEYKKLLFTRLNT